MAVDKVGLGETVYGSEVARYIHQGGTHEEMLLPAKSIVDGAPGLFAKARVLHERSLLTGMTWTFS